jgi:FAD/FMN-containing dehydrogenase
MKNGIHAQGDHHRDTVANCDIGVTPRAMATRHADTVPTAQSNSSHADAQALAVALQERVYGEVRFDDGSRTLYATDGSNYRQTPIGVVIPRDLNDMIETVAAARRFGAPILARGGGTSLAGQ